MIYLTNQVKTIRERMAIFMDRLTKEEKMLFVKKQVTVETHFSRFESDGLNGVFYHGALTTVMGKD